MPDATMVSVTFPQRCKVCGKRDKFDFSVSDEVWELVVPEPYRNRVVCLGCFDAFASQKGVRYAHALAKEIYFAGDGASFLFETRTRTEVSGCH